MLNKISIQKIAFIYILCLVQPASAWSFFGFGRNTPEPQQSTQPEQAPELDSEELLEHEDQDQEQEQEEIELEHEPARLYTPVTILLDPAGDAKTTGRTIDDSFERSLTLQCAQQIKARLETQYARRNVKVVLTRFAGDTLEPLQAAQFANRLPVDLYMSLNFYASKQVPHPVYLYYFTYTPDLDIKDMNIKHTQELAFYPHYQAYLLHRHETQQYVQLCSQALEKTQNEHKLICQPSKGLPFKPLLGVTVPALACEIGIHKKNDWKNLVEPLTSALSTIIDQLQAGSSAS